MGDVFVIYPTCGLCNYLRVLMSYYLYCKSTDKQLICIWNDTYACPGFFLDYFEPLENVIFLRQKPNNIVINYHGYDCHPNFNDSTKFIYDDLKLLPHMEEEVNKIINKIPDKYTALHIRRTDFVVFSKEKNNYIKDDEFINFCNKTNNNYIYLATDNNNTQELYKNIYKNNLYFYNEIDNSISLAIDNNNKKELYQHFVQNKLEHYDKIENYTFVTSRRFTDLNHAIIDIYVCVAADKFMGTPLSSFSYLIEQLRLHSRK